MTRRKLKVHSNLTIIIDTDKKGVNIFHDNNFICYFNWNKKQHIEIKKPKNELNKYLSELKLLNNNTAQKLVNYFVKLESKIKKTKEKEKEKQSESSEQIERTIANLIINKYGDKLLTLRETDEFCLYNKGYYQKGIIAKTKIKQDINRIGKKIEGFKYNLSSRNSIYDIIRSETYVLLNTFYYNENIINVLNGLLIKKNKIWGLIPHKNIEKPIRTFTQLPINFDPKATCPEINEEFKLIVGKNYINDIYEMIGYFLIPTVKYHKAFMLFGPPSSGKTTIVEIVEKLIGEEHISKIKLHDMGRDFQLAELRDKMVNIGDDLSEKPITYTTEFNKVCSNKRLSCQIKGIQEHIKWNNITKNLFGCNILPDNKSVSEGFYRRWVLIPCYNIFVTKKLILDYGEKISTPEELSGLLNKCLEALLILEDRGRFRQDEEYIRVTWELERNPVAQYTERYCHISELRSIDCELFYQMICNWRKKRGLPEISKSKCTRSLKLIYPHVKVISVNKSSNPGSSGYKYYGINYMESFVTNNIKQSIRIRKAFEDQEEENEGERDDTKNGFEDTKDGFEALERGEEVDQAVIFKNINIDNSDKIDANKLYEFNDGLEWDPF